MPTKTLSRELRICLAIWRKAWRERGGDPVVMNCRNYNSAIALRQSMYRAIRPFRNGESFDEDLRQASEFFVVYLGKQGEEGEPHQLILKERTTLTELDASLESLGLTENDLLLTDEKLVGADLGKFLEIEEKPKKRRGNQFYERND